MKSMIDELPVYTLGYELNTSCKIIVHYLLPASVSLLVYLLLILSDFSLAVYQLSYDNTKWGALILVWIFTPGIASCIFILSSPERWPSDDTFGKENLRFLALNIWHGLCFPFAATYRYVHQIFWSIEAICANYISHSDRTENALRILMKPNSMELYFFLQAYLHSAPQIFLQLYTIYDSTDSAIVNVQIMSIIMSLIRMAITTTNYQRFERRKVLGVNYPWTAKRMLQPKKTFVEIQKLQESIVEKKPLYNPLVPANLLLSGSEEEHEPKSSENLYNSSSTLYEEPSGDIEVELRRSRDDLQEDEVLRANIVDMSKHVTPPSNPAPRPTTIMGFKDLIVTNATTFVDHIPKRRHRDYDEMLLPVRVRRQVIKGVEQDDGVAKFVGIIAWMLFIASRMLTLTTFFYFYPTSCIVVCSLHWFLCTSLLLWNSWSTEEMYRKFFYVFLGYVYLFCLVELKVKFRKVRLWYGIYFVIVFIENFVLTVLWFWFGSGYTFWYFFILLMTAGTFLLSSMCFFVYFSILKPKAVVVYPGISCEGVCPAVI